MRRSFTGCCVLAAMLGLPSAALAATGFATAANAPVAPASAGAPSPATARSAHHIVARGTLSGTAVSVNGSWITIRTPGSWSGVIDELTGTATRITRKNYPYVYGGGHAQAGVASIGIPGPGYNGSRVGFDCSGSVAAVLAGGGLWQWGSGVPNDYWIVQQLLSEGLIAPGVGRGTAEVTLYDNPNYHIFMNIDGGFFGTSDGGGGGDAAGGPGWLYDGAAFAPSYEPYHVVSWALKGSGHSGREVTFEMASSRGGFKFGQKVRISYVELRSGIFVATAITTP